MDARRAEKGATAAATAAVVGGIGIGEICVDAEERKKLKSTRMWSHDLCVAARWMDGGNSCRRGRFVVGSAANYSMRNRPNDGRWRIGRADGGVWLGMVGLVDGS
jgi:hypothetical protein